MRDQAGESAGAGAGVRGITLGRKRVQFAVPIRPHEVAEPVEPMQLGTLATVLRFSEGRRFSADLTGVRPERLTGELLAALAAICALGGAINSPHTAARYASVIRRFARHIRERHPARVDRFSVSDITPGDVAAFESRLRAASPRDDAASAYHEMVPLIQLLRWWRDHHPARLSAQTAKRVDYIVDLGIGRHLPRDAYSPRVARALREASEREIPPIIERITVRGEAALAAGRDPDIHGWDEPANVLWAIAHTGVVQKRGDAPGRAGILHDIRLANLHELLYPRVRDLVPFLILLALSTDIPVECLTALEDDCLKNSARGLVEIRYLKRRAHGHEWRTEQVLDGGLPTPGGIVRALLRLTRRAREHLHTKSLWVAYGGGRLHRVKTWSRPRAVAHIDPVAQFVVDHDVRDEDGSPLRLHLVRLRKTRRAERYILSRGQLEVFAGTVHTPRVAGDHYGDIPILRHVHEAAIEQAEREALAQATARLLTPDEETSLLAEPERGSHQLGLAPERVPAFLAGESDLWLASCLDFFNSPFGEEGRACPVPFFACLGCPNAVITARNLPAIIAFLNHIVGERQVLPEPEWGAMYAGAYYRIVMQILPTFPAATVAGARAVAECDRNLIYLPPNLTELRHAE